MKILALASIALCCAGSAIDSRPESDAITRGDDALTCWSARNIDEPPPLECPMCGGNADLHRRRTEFLFEARAIALLAVLTTR